MSSSDTRELTVPQFRAVPAYMGVRCCPLRLSSARKMLRANPSGVHRYKVRPMTRVVPTVLYMGSFDCGLDRRQAVRAGSFSEEYGVEESVIVLVVKGVVTDDVGELRRVRTTTAGLTPSRCAIAISRSSPSVLVFASG